MGWNTIKYDTLPEDSYEGLLNKLINRRMTRQEFSERSMEMAKRNTDWFEILFRNTLICSKMFI